jgi:hypothetical protein
MDFNKLHRLYFNYALQLEEPNYFFHVDDALIGEVRPLNSNEFKSLSKTGKYQEKIVNNPDFKKYLVNKRFDFYEE